MRIFSAATLSSSLARQRRSFAPRPNNNYANQRFFHQRNIVPQQKFTPFSWTKKLSFWFSPLIPFTKNKFTFPLLSFFSTQASTHPSTSTAHHSSKFKHLADSLKKAQIIGDVVDDFTPSVELKASFPKGDAKDGAVFRAEELHYVEPDVSWPVHEKNALFTLIKVDPDAPSRSSATSREWRHWLIVNIPGNDISKGEVVTPYMGPNPPKDSGLHRYVFLLYKQNDRIFPPSMDNSGHHRGMWKAKKFAQEYGLGSPVGATWYQAEY
jgi:phosphatidylethanolamine-binding protein (PEBP) family uncharacterized protein